MIVLDTDVVSELMRRTPEPGVIRWVDRFPAGDVFVTAVTAAELLYGWQRRTMQRSPSLANVPAGRSAWRMRRPQRFVEIGALSSLRGMSTTLSTLVSRWSIRGISPGSSPHGRSSSAMPRLEKAAAQPDSSDENGKLTGSLPYSILPHWSLLR